MLNNATETIFNLSALRFLVVEDDLFMCSITSSILRSLGARNIKEAEDAAEAFVILDSYNADIIITDWTMTPLDGIEFTDMIRNGENSPNPMVPIIMAAAYSDVAQVMEARDAGITEYVTKPMSPRSLYLRIAEVIEHPRQFVRTDSFFGPDRRRHRDDGTGPRRRKTDKKKTEQDTAEPQPLTEKTVVRPGRQAGRI